MVPDIFGYLTRVNDAKPQMSVDTANGATRPEAIGETTISMFDDCGKWHSFAIDNVWVMRSCNEMLYYSQSKMRKHGVVHRLDDGYIEFNDGS